MSDTSLSETCTAVIQSLIQLIREQYVYPEIGVQIAAQLQVKLDDGAYDDLVNEGELAMRLTQDLRALSGDLHWRVAYTPREAAERGDSRNKDTPKRPVRRQDMFRKTNYGFERVERLNGNVGYIDLRRFAPSTYGGETAVAAMNFVANTDALILDLRQTLGGYPSMVQLIISYLVDPEPRHINTFYYRPTDNTQQFWTFPHVPGKRRPDIPVYVLVSHATGSGAEELAYNLKHMERATLIGETTVGAAHPVTRKTILNQFEVSLPYGRPINPITGTNWEGTGVEPHIEVPAQDALKTAHLAALEHLASTCEDEDEKSALAWSLEIVESEYAPLQLDECALSRCSGTFGKRRFFVENGALIYRHQDIPMPWSLVPMTQTRFRLNADIKFEFLFQDGKVSAVETRYRDRRPPLVAERTDEPA